jgi:hypothetical protein
MLETAQEELDDKLIECNAFRFMNKTMRKQIVADNNRISVEV